MPTFFTLYDLLMFSGIAHGVFCSAMLTVGIKNRTLQNQMLGLLLGILSLTLADLWFIDRYPLNIPAHLRGIFLSTPYAIGPAFYFYSRALTGTLINRRQFFLHSLAFLMAFGLFSLLQIANPHWRVELSLILINSELSQFLAYLLIIIQFILLLVYLLAILKLLTHYRFRLSLYYSDLAGLELRWLSLIDGSFLFMLIVVSLLVAADVAGYSLSWRPGQLFSLCMLLILYSLSIFGWRQTSITPLQIEETDSEPKYERSGLNPAEIKGLISRLNSLMDEKRPYLQPGLNLIQLAEQLELRPQQLSQLLNKQLNSSFYDYINQHRINAAKKLLEKCKPSDSILDICFAVGYNSKATFNNAFRKFTGTTPSEYRKSRILN